MGCYIGTPIKDILHVIRNMQVQVMQGKTKLAQALCRSRLKLKTYQSAVSPLFLLSSCQSSNRIWNHDSTSHFNPSNILLVKALRVDKGTYQEHMEASRGFKSHRRSTRALLECDGYRWSARALHACRQSCPGMHHFEQWATHASLWTMCYTYLDMQILIF